MPWLDTRPLAPADLPRPWSDDDYERDRRRAEATGVLAEFGRDVWEMYAEQGKDAVTELLTKGARRAHRRGRARLPRRA